MNEINDEIKLTLNLMQADIDGGAHGELQGHLYSLLEIKRNELQRRLTERSLVEPDNKPLTTEELKAGGWWCADFSKECANALKSKNLRVFNSDEWGGGDGLWVGCVMDACGDVKRKGVFFDFVGKKQIRRIGNDFYWEAVVICDFDHCKNEAVGMVGDTKEVLGDDGCRNLRAYSMHFYCNQHMREPINYG